MPITEDDLATDEERELLDAGFLTDVFGIIRRRTLVDDDEDDCELEDDAAFATVGSVKRSAEQAVKDARK